MTDSWPCADCGVDTFPWEIYMLTDEAWAEAGAVETFLCIGCVEDRLGRGLVSDDFPPIPLNDDNERDSVRLRVRKGSGRHTYPLYGLCADAVVELGADEKTVAERFGLDPDMLKLWVKHARSFGDAPPEMESGR